MSRPKMIYLEDEKTIMDFYQILTGGKLVVSYLTYDQLNDEKFPLKNNYDLKIKHYSNGVYKVCWYKKTRKKSNHFIHQKINLEKRLKMSKSELEKLDEQQKKSYIFEVKNKIKDYVLNNHFDTFLTLTFDPKKCNEAIEDEYRFKEMQRFLHNMRRKHKYKSDKPFNYIAIPERHKSGLIHWHLVTGYIDFNLVDSGKVYKKQKIYNCLDWEYGFSNVQCMRSKSKVSSYITKYITKDLLYSPVRKHKRKYWCSKGLELPKVYAGSYSDLVNILPLYDEYGRFKPMHSNDVCDIWLFKA